MNNATLHEFHATAAVQRQQAVFSAECGCTRALHAEYRKRHESLEKIVVLDGSRFRWEGLGNSGTRWMGLLRWGYATGRAVFLRISREETPRLDLGEYFEGWGGVDWHWAAQKAAVRKTLAARGVRPVVLQYSCAKHARGPGCAIVRLKFAKNGSIYRELSEPAGLLQWMRSSDSPPYVKLVLAQQDSLEFSYGKPEALRTTLPLTTCPVAGAPAFSSRERCLKCETYAFMQPRPKLAAALVPLLRRLDPFDVVVGVHLRTGYADWAFRNDDTYFRAKGKGGGRMAASAGVAAAAAAKAAASAAARNWSLDEHWRMLDDYFSDCKRGRPGPCFNWVSPRNGVPPSRADAMRCGAGWPMKAAVAAAQRGGGPRRVVDESHLMARLDGVPEGFLSTMLLCGARLGQAMSAAAPAPSKKWGLLILSDSPAFPSLATRVPALRGRAVNTAGAGAGQLGHSSFARSCSTRKGCAKGKDPGGAWTRSLVDFYLAGLADGFVKGLFTSFLFSTMRRDLLCCEPGAFVQWLGWYNLSRSHRDVPMTDRAFLEALTRT